MKQTQSSDALVLEEMHPLAGLLCLSGLFLRLVLSDPLLNALGIHYSGDMEGSAIEKIHPGTYIIFLSFFVLLWDEGNPVGQIGRCFKGNRLYMLYLFLYLVIFVLWLVKSPVGIGLLIDTHIPVVITAIVLSYTPKSYCRTAVKCFLLLAVVNSLIGIAESIGRFRIFTFDPTWTVMQEAIFRSSALLGHPLSNAMFTTVAVYVAMGMRFSVIAKSVMLAIFLASLVAFGGRGGFGLTVIGLIPLGVGRGVTDV